MDFLMIAALGSIMAPLLLTLWLDHRADNNMDL